MFKIVFVLCAVAAVASAGYVGAPLAYTAPVAYAAPLATSYQNTYKISRAGLAVAPIAAPIAAPLSAYAAAPLAYASAYSPYAYSPYAYSPYAHSPLLLRR